MVGINRNRALESDFVPIPPGECAIPPIQIESVPLYEQNLREQGEVSSCGLNRTVFWGCVRRSNNSVSAFQNQWS